MQGISPHGVRVFEHVRRHPWDTTRGIQAGTGDAYRTVSNHCKRFADGGVFERLHVYDGCRYRVAEDYADTELGRVLERVRCVIGEQ